MVVVWCRTCVTISLAACSFSSFISNLTVSAATVRVLHDLLTIALGHILVFFITSVTMSGGKTLLYCYIKTDRRRYLSVKYDIRLLSEALVADTPTCSFIWLRTYWCFRFGLNAFWNQTAATIAWFGYLQFCICPVLKLNKWRHLLLTSCFIICKKNWIRQMIKHKHKRPIIP
jgi:nucleoside recognition membrane protein YjiH